MNGLEKLQVRMNADGSSLKQDKINSAVSYIDDTFKDDPSYQSEGVQIVDGDKIYPRIWNYKKEDNLSPTVEIQTQIFDKFQRGQLFILDNEYWLCLKSQCFHDMYWTGKLKLCTHLLHYQDVKTKEIESSWAVLERPYSRTLSNGQVIITSEMEFKARLPFNDSTKKINLDRRLLTGLEYDKNGDEIGSVYKVTGRDAGSQVINGEGFLVLNMKQVPFSAGKDNLELMIADYRSPDSPIPPVDPDPTLLKCEIIGSSILKCGGTARNYNAIFYQADGIIPDETVSAVWAVDIPAEYTDKIILELNGNFILLSCADAVEMVGVRFDLRLCDDSGLYETNIKNIEVISAI